MSLASFLTDFADQAVILPLAAGIPLALLATGWRRGALAWGLAVGGTLATMLVLKLVFGACGWLWPEAGLNSPSGHTASGSVVYGGLMALAVARPEIGRTVLLALAWAALFAFTRLVLGAHTPAEVTVGAAVGVAGAVTLRLLAGPHPIRVSAGAAATSQAGAPALALLPRGEPFPAFAGLGRFLPFAAVAGMALLLHGYHLDAEVRIQHAGRLLWMLSVCRPDAWSGLFR